jgi:hypothetical protein
VLVLDVTEEEADKLLLTLDPLAAMAETDAERIKALLETVRTDDEAVQELFKRTAGERLWRVLHPQEIDEAEVAPERADELRAQWGTASGQVWKIEQHRIICGDCTDETVTGRLFGNGDARRLRLIWTDPPYGVSYGAKTAWMKQNGAQAQRKPIHNDDLAPAQVAALFSAALTKAVAHAERGAAIYATVPAGPLIRAHSRESSDGPSVRSDGGLHWKPSDARRATDPVLDIAKALNRPDWHQRKTVSGWAMISLSRHWGPPAREQDPKQPIPTRKHGRRVLPRSSTAI